MPDNLHIAGDISLIESSITELPEGLHAESLYIDGTDISSIPESTHIEDTLSIYDTKVRLDQIPVSVKPKKIYSPTEIGVKYDGATREKIE